MIRDEPLPLKKMSLRALFFSCALLTAYVLFIALVSVWVGISHLDQDGSWMPILVGTLVVITVLVLFLRLIRFILDQARPKEAFHL